MHLWGWSNSSATSSSHKSLSLLPRPPPFPRLEAEFAQDSALSENHLFLLVVEPRTLVRAPDKGDLALCFPVGSDSRLLGSSWGVLAESQGLQ